MKLFIHHDGAVGDVLLSVPSLKKIKAQSAFVHLAAQGDAAVLLKNAGVADAITPVGHALFSSLYTTPDERVKQFLSAFDVAVVFAAAEGSSTAIAIRGLVPDTRLIRTIPPAGSGMHAGGYRFSQVSDDALPADAHRLVIPLYEDNVPAWFSASGLETGKKLLAVHPGSGGRSKCWPMPRYLELIERLQRSEDLSVLLFTGLAEEPDIKNAVEQFAAVRKNVHHVGSLDLSLAASLLSCCDLYIGNDSGFSHLAACMGCPAIALFGLTDPVVWKPAGSRVAVLSAVRSRAVEDISVEAVFQKAVQLLKQKPS